MAGTSIHEKIVYFAKAHYGDADDPMDAVMMRDGVLNNALVLADEYAQVRCNWMSIVGGSGQGYVGLPSSFAADTWYRIGEFARFPIQLRHTGRPYRLRIRIAGATTNAGGAARFAAVLSPPGYLTPPFLDDADDSIYITSETTSTSHAWLGGVSQGSAARVTMLELSSELAARWATPASTLDDLGGNPATMSQVIVALTVFAKNASASYDSRLSGVYAAEYIGGEGGGASFTSGFSTGFG